MRYNIPCLIFIILLFNLFNKLFKTAIHIKANSYRFLDEWMNGWMNESSNAHNPERMQDAYNPLYILPEVQDSSALHIVIRVESFIFEGSGRIYMEISTWKQTTMPIKYNVCKGSRSYFPFLLFLFPSIFTIYPFMNSVVMESVWSIWLRDTFFGWKNDSANERPFEGSENNFIPSHFIVDIDNRVAA